MPDVTESLLKRNLYAVYGERDAEKRRAVIADIWSADADFIDPDGHHSGQAASDEAVARLQRQFPEYVFPNSVRYRRSTASDAFRGHLCRRATRRRSPGWTWLLRLEGE